MPLDFECFPHKRHTAKNIAKWRRRANRRWGETVQDNSCSTIDGAANGQKSMLYMKPEQNYRVCSAHQLGRCAKHATGDAGGQSSTNPKCKELLARNRAEVTQFHRSVQLSKCLIEAQLESGTLHKNRKEYIKNATVPGQTRWAGEHEMLRRNRVMESLDAEYTKAYSKWQQPEEQESSEDSDSEEEGEE